LRRVTFSRGMTPTAESLDGNRGDSNAFTAELFERKAHDIWLSTINRHRSDPNKLWDDINILLQPPAVTPMLHTAMDHATFFRSNIERIRASTAVASQPLLTKRSRNEVLSSFSPVLEAEAI
jgi:hypothetical protein